MEPHLDKLEALIRENQVRAATEAKGRQRLLWVAALVTLGVAGGFLLSVQVLTSSASFGPAIRHVPLWPFSMVALSAGSAVLLVIGLRAHHLRWQLVGIVGISLFYAVMMLTFATNNLDRLDGETAGPRPAIYPMFIYLHMTWAMATHARTTWKLLKAGAGE